MNLSKEMIIRNLRREGIPTGSRVMGLAKENSDWDLIINEEVYQKYVLPYENYFDFRELTEYEECVGDRDITRPTCYITFENKKYNVIHLPDGNSYKAWKNTTQLIKLFPRHLLIERERRIKIFKFLVSIFREYGREKNMGINPHEDQEFWNNVF